MGSNPRLYPNEDRGLALAGHNLHDGWSKEEYRAWLKRKIARLKRMPKNGFIRQKIKYHEQQLAALDAIPTPAVRRALTSPDGYTEVRYRSAQKGGRVIRETWVSEPMENEPSLMRRRNMTAREANADYAKKVRAGWEITRSNPPRREWWITDSGVMYADGDVGDVGHEAIAFEYITRDIAGYLDLEFDSEYAEQLSELIDEIAAILVEDGVIQSADQLEDFQSSPEDFITTYLLQDTDIREHYKSDEQVFQAVAIAFAGPVYDARDYAMKYMGWKRMAGNWIQTQTLSRGDLQDINSGLHEIISELDEDPGTFNIEVNATGKVYVEVPWEVIAQGNPAKLRKYESVGF